MPSVIQNAMRSSKTSTRQMKTRIVPIAPVFTISSRRLRMGPAASFQTSTLTPAGGS